MSYILILFLTQDTFDSDNIQSTPSKPMPFQDHRFPCLGVKHKINSLKWLVDNISLSFTAATTQI